MIRKSVIPTRVFFQREYNISESTESIHLLRKSMDWFLYDNGLRHERVKISTRY